LAADGRPSFQALQHPGTSSTHQIAFYTFDILHLDGKDLTAQSLLQRRAHLSRILVPGAVLRISQDLPGSATDVIQAVRSAGLEGVVAKRRDSPYQPGERSSDWQKLKLDRQQEFVVAGYRPDGEHSFDALLVGYYDAGALRFA